MFKLVINEERCKGCRLCVEECPGKNLRLSETFNKRGHHYIEILDEKECSGCQRCALICPDIVIEIYRSFPKESNGETNNEPEVKRET